MDGDLTLGLQTIAWRHQAEGGNRAVSMKVAERGKAVRANSGKRWYDRGGPQGSQSDSTNSREEDLLKDLLNT